MKLITRDTDYAIRALCYIAGGKKAIVSAAELVEALQVPRPFLRKLLQVLNREKVLVSYKGKGGGFALAKPCERIQVADLIEIFQGQFSLNECYLKKALCPNRGSCSLRKKIMAIENNVLIGIKAITIASLLS